jgi:uncharacterized protein (DUF2236 family)
VNHVPAAIGNSRIVHLRPRGRGGIPFTVTDAHPSTLRDDGLFGPESVTWRVHASPAMLIGGLRALLIQTLHPLAMAGVAQHSDYRTRGLHRLRRTTQYVLTVTFGDRQAAEAAGQQVRTVHRHIRGVDPVTGRSYSADDPETLLWVHCAEVHSFCAAYRAYVGRLSDTERDRYFAESARAAALVGIPKEMVPKSRTEMRAYFARVRPSLCVSESALEAIRFLTAPPLSRRHLRIGVSMRIAAAAAIGLIPSHLRALMGVERPWAVDAATFAGLHAAWRPLSRFLDIPETQEANVARLRAIVAERPFTSPSNLAHASVA